MRPDLPEQQALALRSSGLLRPVACSYLRPSVVILSALAQNKGTKAVLCQDKGVSWLLRAELPSLDLTRRKRGPSEQQARVCRNWASDSWGSLRHLPVSDVTEGQVTYDPVPPGLKQKKVEGRG